MPTFSETETHLRFLSRLRGKRIKIKQYSSRQEPEREISGLFEGVEEVRIGERSYYVGLVLRDVEVRGRRGEIEKYDVALIPARYASVVMKVS